MMLDCVVDHHQKDDLFSGKRPEFKTQRAQQPRAIKNNVGEITKQNQVDMMNTATRNIESSK